MCAPVDHMWWWCALRQLRDCGEREPWRAYDCLSSALQCTRRRAAMSALGTPGRQHARVQRSAFRGAALRCVRSQRPSHTPPWIAILQQLVHIPASYHKAKHARAPCREVHAFQVVQAARTRTSVVSPVAPAAGGALCLYSWLPKAPQRILARASDQAALRGLGCVQCARCCNASQITVISTFRFSATCDAALRVILLDVSVVIYMWCAYGQRSKELCAANGRSACARARLRLRGENRRTVDSCRRAAARRRRVAASLQTHAFQEQATNIWVCKITRWRRRIAMKA